MAQRNDTAIWSGLFRISAESGQTLQAQIRQAIVAAILDRQIAASMPLPSCRVLAEKLGVARGTVVLAFQQLVDQGFLIARERRGHFVNPEVLATPAKPQQKTGDAAIGEIDWKARRKIAASDMPRPAKHENWIKYSYPFVYGQFDPALFPTAEWRECNRMALAVLEIRNWAADMIDRDDPLLIEQIQARLLPRRGIFANPDEIIVTLGAQNALYMLATLLMGKGSKVAMEDPGYPDARSIFRLAGAEIHADAGRPVRHRDQRHPDRQRLRVRDAQPSLPDHGAAQRRAPAGSAGARAAVQPDHHRGRLRQPAHRRGAAAGAEEPRPLRPRRLCRLDVEDARPGAAARLHRRLRRPDHRIARVAPLHAAGIRRPTTSARWRCSCRSAITRRWCGGFRPRSTSGASGWSRRSRPSCRSGARPIRPAARRCGWKGRAAPTRAALAEAAACRSVIIEAGDRFFDRIDKPTRFMRLGISSIALQHIEPGIRELATAAGRRPAAA